MYKILYILFSAYPLYIFSKFCLNKYKYKILKNIGNLTIMVDKYYKKKINNNDNKIISIKNNKTILNKYTNLNNIVDYDELEINYI